MASAFSCFAHLCASHRPRVSYRLAQAHGSSECRPKTNWACHRLGAVFLGKDADAHRDTFPNTITGSLRRVVAISFESVGRDSFGTCKKCATAYAARASEPERTTARESPTRAPDSGHYRFVGHVDIASILKRTSSKIRGESFALSAR